MKALAIFLIVAGVCCLIYVLGSSAIKSKADQKVERIKDSLYVAYVNDTAGMFIDGEILLPDMVHSDTLKVINASLLNRLIPNTDGSDYELNEVLMLGCDVIPEDKYNSHNMMRDYQIDLYMDTLWVYDYKRLVGRYTTNWRNQIDTIILKDNQ